MSLGHWQRHLPGALAATALGSWLREPGSLTARCQRHCCDFCVRLLHAGRGRPLAEEGLFPEGGRALSRIREVALECDGRPVIFAHTTLSMAHRGRLSRWLARLGSRSLGSLLFAFPGFRRGDIEFRRLDRRHPLFRRAAALGEVGPDLWARRSCHRLGGQVVVVTEVFLPAILDLLPGQTARRAAASADKE